MKGTEKQIAYAQSLLAQFVQPRAEEIDAAQKMIDRYEEKLASGDTSKDYAARIEKRRAVIAKAKRQIDAANAIEDAGELIDAIKYNRYSLYN